LSNLRFNITPDHPSASPGWDSTRSLIRTGCWLPASSPLTKLNSHPQTRFQTTQNHWAIPNQNRKATVIHPWHNSGRSTPLNTKKDPPNTEKDRLSDKRTLIFDSHGHSILTRANQIHPNSLTPESIQTTRVLEMITNELCF
jgi:hypothetical protein